MKREVFSGAPALEVWLKSCLHIVFFLQANSYFSLTAVTKVIRGLINLEFLMVEAPVLSGDKA